MRDFGKRQYDLDSDERGNSLMFLQGTWVNLGTQNCVSKRGNLVVLNEENVNNEH